MSHSLAKLHARALDLYQVGAQEGAKISFDTWAREFTLVELSRLWHEYCVLTPQNPLGAPYDDEVYEALGILGYWEYV